MAYDVRAIANWVLDCADAEGRSLSNLSINKIVFFLHASYLARFERPLVSAKVEAWQYGPVFREVYREFKCFSNEKITARATRIDPSNGQTEICTVSLPSEDDTFLRKILASYIQLSPSALVDLSHQTGGPWDSVWNYAGRANPSMKISDDIIMSWFKTSVKH
jgi:uncharacterized phage-associated protein